VTAGSPTFNLSHLFELVADALPDRTALVVGDVRMTYADLDARANRFANALVDAGIGRGDHVGLQLLNGPEYLEGMLAAFKLGAVPVNVNYRYVENELRYLFDDADLVALVYHRQFGQRVAVAASGLDQLRHFVVVEDGSGEAPVEGSVGYEDALAAASAERPAAARSSDDHYIAYTGGTTGMPKGVVWRHEDIFFAAMGGGDPLQMGNFITSPEELAERLPEVGAVSLMTPPLIHVSAQWGVFSQLYSGGTVVIPPEGRFEPDVIWRLVGDEKVNIITIVGDAMARPLLDAHAAAAAAGTPYDTSAMFVLGSGGAILSPATKQQIASQLPNVIVVDGYGSSETGVVGAKAGGTEGPRFAVNDSTAVLDDDGRPIAPGSGAVGRMAKRGRVPIGYYNDEAKTASTFLTIDGVRWVLPGDMATVEADGTVVVLGRGSVSINTGGEKVYPEEVESVLKAHPEVEDAVVVGVPDDRWGERVVAVAQARGAVTPALGDLQEFCRTQLAGYKVPRELVMVDEIVRSPAGKPDYRWAKDTAVNALGGATR
jgi:acyl-CoA synthetase (AMP-forming)/AMP-acid ligase II